LILNKIVDNIVEHFATFSDAYNSLSNVLDNTNLFLNNIKQE
jgi:hypothetical protein